MDSLLYLLFMNENTQKDAIETLYDREYDSINVTPFTNARERMLQKGWLESDGSLRGAKFKTNLKPFIDYVADEKDLSTSQKNGFRELVTSEWFRGFFQLEILDEAPEVGRNNNGRMGFQLGSEGAFHTLGLVVDDLGSLSYTQRAKAKEWLKFDPKNISPNNLEEVDDFDSQIEDLKQGQLIESPEDFLEALFQSEILGHCRVQELTWRRLFLERIVKEQLAFKLPDLSDVVPIYHLNSDLWGKWPNLGSPEEQ